MAGLNVLRSLPLNRPDTRMPVTPSGMSGNVSIIEILLLVMNGKDPRPFS
jgi:hypothetical protein